jgi:hypothetical protein
MGFTRKFFCRFGSSQLVFHCSFLPDCF